jgi:MFS family permease
MFIPFAHVSAAARDLGVDDARAVGLVGLIGIGSLTGRFAIGALADRVGRPLTLALAMASMGLCFLLWWGPAAMGRDGAVLAVDGAELRRHRLADAGHVHGPVRRPGGVGHHRHAVHRRGAGQPAGAVVAGAVFDPPAATAR